MSPGSVPPPTPAGLELIWKNATYFLSGLLFTVFGWLGRRQLNRIDTLEDDIDNCATKEDVHTLHLRLDDIFKILLNYSKQTKRKDD